MAGGLVFGRVSELGDVGFQFEVGWFKGFDGDFVAGVRRRLKEMSSSIQWYCGREVLWWFQRV